jgi:hypothetical protein
MYLKVFAIASALLLAACNPEPPALVTPYQPVNDVHHVMELILDPATDVIWGSAGTIISEEGRRELAPTTDEGWHKVEQAAAVVTESGNLLMMPGRSGGEDWNEYSSGLIEAGKLAMKAAQDQDSDALFDAGGRLYQVCLACHNQYWVEVDDTTD